MTRHHPAFDKRGAKFMIPPIALCTGKEGKIETILPERINCPRCLAIVETIPTEKADRLAWFAAHGIR